MFGTIKESVTVKDPVQISGTICPRSDSHIAYMGQYKDPLMYAYL